MLSISESKPNSALAQIATFTGGRFVQQREANQWPQAMRELARSAAPDYLVRPPTDIAFAGSLGFLPKRSANPLNRTWLKNDATSAGTAQLSGETIPAAGVWQLGGGRVVSIATGLPPNDAALVADRLGQLPSDPRMKITWSDSSELAVRIDATEANAFLNGLALKLQLTNPSTGAQQTQAIPQTGPGEYEVSLSASAEAMLATITLDGRVIARRAVAGHYPREFYPLGNDRTAMQKLAELTGGEVIEPTDDRPIDFRWPTRTLSLAPWLAALGALAIAGALVVWRRR